MQEDNKTTGLHTNIANAAAIRQMCQTEGFKILQKTFEEKIKKITGKILDPETPQEEILNLRSKAYLWVEIEKVLKTLLMTGELSKRALDISEDNL